MKISTRARYGLRLMLELALRQGQGPVFLRDVAKSQEISEKYLSTIIIPLKTAGFVTSYRGSHGGYELSREPERVNLREIVSTLEGDLGLVDCVANPRGCGRVDLCAVREVWGKVGAAIAATLEGMTLRDLVEATLAKKEGGASYTI
jgi:Rrf2 family protein